MAETKHFVEEPILEISIRSGEFVRIHGIPWDLTQQEAEKIVAVIKAHALLAPPPGDAL